MKYTNKLNLPKPLVAALKYDEYSAGHSDYTPSSLLRPAYMQKLESMHEAELDVSDMYFAMMGKAIHKVIEESGQGEKSYFSEERIYMKFEKWTISMMFDSLYLDAKKGILDDYKGSTVWKFMLDERKTLPAAPDWEFQLNMGAYILRKGGYVTQPIPMSKVAPGNDCFSKIPFSPIQINEIRIIGLLRDYAKSKAKREWKYPQNPVQIRNFAIWDDERIEDEIRERATIRDNAKANPLGSTEPCSGEETWATEDKWALMRSDRKRAVKLFSSEKSLLLYKYDICGEMTEKQIEKYYTEFRPGERKRCEDYCSVSHACPFYKEFKEGAKK